MGMAGPAVIADAYDLYADQLYAYCRFFARDPADAVEALESVFLVAAGRGAALPLDGQLRAWLFAVARNECLRGVRSRRTAASEPGRKPGGPADRRAERELLTAAADGLAPGDRDVVALLWHGLDPDDIAAVLGIGRELSAAWLEAARGRLETAAGALLVARSGRADCPGLARLLGGWNGRLDVPLVHKITQHAERCGRCLSRRRGALSPELVVSLAPDALLGAGVSAEALRPAAASAAELRDQVLSLACDPSAEGAEARRRACGLAGPFGLALPQAPREPATRSGGGDFSRWTGFPVPIPAEAAGGGPRNRLAMALTGAAVLALAVTATFAVAGPGPDSRNAAASASLPPTVSVPPGVTLRWNADDTTARGVLPVTVRGGRLAWSVSSPNRGVRLSPASGTSSASVTITDRRPGDLRPLTVVAGNGTYTVTLTTRG